MRIIGTKRLNLKKDNLGYIKAFAVNLGTEWVMANAENVPSAGEVFVPLNFNALNKYNENEMFICNNIELMDNIIGSCDYRANGENCSNIDYFTEDIFSLIDIDQSLDQAETLRIVSKVKPTKICFVRSIMDGSSVIAGPYESGSTTLTSEYNYSCVLGLIGNNNKYFSSLKAHSVYVLEENVLPNNSLISTGQAEHFLISGLRNFINSSIEPLQVPVIADETLIKFIDDIVPKQSDKLGRKGKRELARIITASKTLSAVNKKRLEELFDKENETTKELMQSLQSRLGLSNNNVTKEVSNEKNIELESELQSKKDQIEEQKNLISSLNDQIGQIEDKTKKEFEDNITNLNAELNDAQKALKDDITRKDIQTEIHQLTGQKNLLESEKEGLEDTVSSLKRDLASNTRQFRDQALKVLPFFEIMQNVKNDNSADTIKEFIPNEFESFDSLNHLLDKIAERVKNMGYIEDESRLKSIVALTLSSKFVGFYGAAGVGKTTLANYLSQAISGRALEQNCYGQSLVRVAKGWTSHTDFVGYFNSFSNKFEYRQPFFKKFENSNTFTSEQFFSLVFDESNLSSPELYLSDFLAETEGMFGNKIVPISLSGRQFSIPNDLRMLFTFNVDETTEELSPRMLDRMPVVTVRNPSIDPSELLNVTTEEQFNPISKINIQELTTFSENDASDDLINSAENIYEFWSTLPNFHISQRKKLQVERYCRIAAEAEMNKSVVIEFIEEAFMLPLLAGFGSDYGKRIEKLFPNISSQEVKSRLQEILSTGETFGVYRHV